MVEWHVQIKSERGIMSFSEVYTWDKISWTVEFKPKHFFQEGRVQLVVGRYKGKWTLLRYVKTAEGLAFGFGWMKFKTMKAARAVAAEMVEAKVSTLPGEA